MYRPMSVTLTVYSPPGREIETSSRPWSARAACFQVSVGGGPSGDVHSHSSTAFCAVFSFQSTVPNSPDAVPTDRLLVLRRGSRDLLRSIERPGGQLARSFRVRIAGEA